MSAQAMFTCFSILFLLQISLIHSYRAFGDSHEQTTLEGPDEATFLRVVYSDGTDSFFRNWECPDGVWAEDLNNHREPKCVCVKGAYAIASTLCDEDFKIVTGDDHCFDIRGQAIRKFIPLTGKSGFAGRANTVFRKDAPYFARLMSSTPTTATPEPVHYLFRMNDPNDFSVYARLGSGKAARLKCFPGQNVAEDPKASPVMHIVKLPNCSNEFRGPRAWCEENNFQDYQWALSVGQGWMHKTGEILRGSKGSCPIGTSSVSGKASRKGRKKRAAKLSRSKKPDISSTLHPEAPEEEPKCDQFDPATVEDEEIEQRTDHFYQVEELDEEKKFHTTQYHQKLVNLQNKRVGHQLRKFYLGGEKGFLETPRFTNFDEFKYVQLSKELLKKVCPKEYIPQAALDFLIRSFRLLYIDSSRNYPYPEKKNEHEHKRIVEALTACQASAEPIYFMKNESCPAAGFRGTNQSNMVFLDNSNLTLPGEQSFNVTTIDVAIELVWKLTLLAHYYCDEKFVNPFDHSLMFVKVEAMLKNPEMLFRWYYPGQFNRMVNFFLMTYNVQKLAKAVDRCVITVFAHSNYTEWLTRPAEVVGWAAKSKMLSHDVGAKINSPLANPEPPRGKAGRKKRFYLQDDIWGKLGYCMHTTQAPYSEVRTSTFISCRKRPIWFDNTD